MQDEETLSVSSDFLYSADGWSKAGKDAARVEMLHAPMLVQGRDDSDFSWWFAAPPKFLGDQSAMYGGVLSFRVGFWEYTGSFVNSSAVHNAYDVVLTSESTGISLGRAGLLVPHAFINSIEVDLTERGGWVVAGTAGAPSKHDMRRVLATLSSLWVRGGYYTGPEETYIMSVRLTSPSSPSQGESPSPNDGVRGDSPAPSDAAARLKTEVRTSSGIGARGEEEAEARDGGVGGGAQGGGGAEGAQSCRSLLLQRLGEAAQVLEGKHGYVDNLLSPSLLSILFLSILSHLFVLFLLFPFLLRTPPPERDVVGLACNSVYMCVHVCVRDF